MMNSRFVFLTVLGLAVFSLANDEESKDVFVPTHEWQVVKKGQSIPKGLHIRINFETGLTEAKLLDKPEKNDKGKAMVQILQETDTIDDQNDDIKKHLVAERLKEALKNIKADDVTTDIENEKKVKNKFKSYEELKKELGSLNITAKSDAEVLSELFKKYEELNKSTHSTEKNILSTLENFEYLVHQIDNGVEFVNLDGFNKIIYKNLNHTNANIKSEALNILGSSVQNNPIVQVHALTTGSIDKLIRMLALANDEEIQNRAVFALGSILRRFPLAQDQFVKNGGLSVFATFFEKPNKHKIQLRIATLIYDLMIEHKEATVDVKNVNYKIQLEQYDNVDLQNKLKEQNWCMLFSNLLVNSVSENFDHDAIERCLNVMSLMDVCIDTFETSVKSILIDLHRHYKNLSEKEIKENLEETDHLNHSFYFVNLKELTYNILKKLYEYKSEL